VSSRWQPRHLRREGANDGVPTAARPLFDAASRSRGRLRGAGLRAPAREWEPSSACVFQVTMRLTIPHIFGAAQAQPLSIHHVWIPIGREALSGSFPMSYLILNSRNHFVGDARVHAIVQSDTTRRRRMGRPRERIRMTPFLHRAAFEVLSNTLMAPRSISGWKFDEARRSWIALSTRPDSQPRNN
jgi:hypothetical protein